MKYVVVDDCGTDIFTDEFDNEQDALDKADLFYNRMTKWEKKRRNALFVLESVDPDEESERHLDGNVIKQLI